MHLTTLNSIHLIRWEKFADKDLVKATVKTFSLEQEVRVNGFWKVGFVFS